MADIKYFDVIQKPIVTEKSMNAMASKKYTFTVHPDANKAMIKEAVEKMFPGTKEQPSVRQLRRRKRSFSSLLTARISKSSKDCRIFAVTAVLVLYYVMNIISR